MNDGVINNHCRGDYKMKYLIIFCFILTGCTIQNEQTKKIDNKQFNDWIIINENLSYLNLCEQTVYRVFGDEFSFTVNLFLPKTVSFIAPSIINDEDGTRIVFEYDHVDVNHKRTVLVQWTIYKKDKNKDVKTEMDEALSIQGDYFVVESMRLESVNDLNDTDENLAIISRILDDEFIIWDNVIK